MNLPRVSLQKARHQDKEVVQIIFAKNEEITELLRQHKGMRWSKTMTCWYLPFVPNLKQELFQLLRGKAWLEYNGLLDHKDDQKAIQRIPERKPVNELSLKQAPTLPKPLAELKSLSETSLKKILEFRNWMYSKRYSRSTIDSYVDSIKTFLRFYSDKPIQEISNNDIILFNNQYILANNFSASFQNQVVNAIKLFFSTVENKQLEPELIHRPKRAKLLPNVLSKEEVKMILASLINIKHKAMLSLIYSCGLRRSELLNLKINDIDSKRYLIIVRQAKGRKDRIVPLSDKILKLLREYYSAYKPKLWLFEGQDKSGRYDERSLASVLKHAVEKSGIKKPVSLHWLRHSYATHLLENGTDLRYIQEILGHASSRTTEIYTHVSNNSIQRIVSPFDSL